MLSDDEIQQALYCVNELIQRRNHARPPVPVAKWMPGLSARLEIACLTSEMSRRGHELDGAGGSLESEIEHWIGTREAADLLGLSTRQVRRLASDLEPENRGRRLLFRRDIVIEYSTKERRDGRRDR